MNVCALDFGTVEEQYSLHMCDQHCDIYDSICKHGQITRLDVGGETLAVKYSDLKITFIRAVVNDFIVSLFYNIYHGEWQFSEINYNNSIERLSTFLRATKELHCKSPKIVSDIYVAEMESRTWEEIHSAITDLNVPLQT
jgi:hypothetical protein